MFDHLPAYEPSLTDYELSIDREIRNGFGRAEQERMSDCVHVLAYYNLDGGAFVLRNEGDNDNLPVESTGLTRRVVDILTSLSYSPPPSRTVLDDPIADKFLSEVYQDNFINSLMRRADVFAHLLGVSAVEAVPAQGNKPIRLYLWDYSQFILRPSEDDATTIEHVITKDLTHDGRLRYTWWSPRFRRVYEGRRGHMEIMASRTTAPVKDTVNPYGRLPFGFVHAEPPVTELTTQGIGNWLSEQEFAINQKRYDLALGIRKYLLPKPYVIGMSAKWQPSDIVGEFMRIPTDSMAQDVTKPSIDYLQARIDIEAAESHIDRAISRVLESSGVPESVYRMDQTSTVSGDALEAEQKPLIDYARNRQECLKLSENDVAEAVLAVGGYWTDNPQLFQAGRGSNLTVEWPQDLVMTPGQDQDTQDRAAMEMGIESLVDVTRRRFRLSTDAEALRKLIKVREDNAKLIELQLIPGVQQNALNIEGPSGPSE